MSEECATQKFEDTSSEKKRIEVKRNTDGFEIRYLDPNPETRYHPRQQSLWSRLREDWQLGWRAPSAYERSREE